MKKKKKLFQCARLKFVIQGVGDGTHTSVSTARWARFSITFHILVIITKIDRQQQLISFKMLNGTAQR